MPTALPQLERSLAASVKRTGVSDGFFLGAAPGIGDLNLFHHLDNARLLEPDLLHAHPQLEEWYERVRDIPRIATFLKVWPHPAPHAQWSKPPC